ncbi:hypothetical protein [Solemya elarraichensis gill symbiont]|nr:hypothetical protein [Solemya elarraichensis gill symbiont]
MLPTSYLLNPEGEIAGYQVGTISREARESYIKKQGKQAKNKKPTE